MAGETITPTAPAPEAPQSAAQIESGLEALFRKSAGQPETGDDPEPEVADDAADDEDDAPAADTAEADSEGGETDQAAADDTEEVEYSGKQYKLPKELSAVVKKASDLERDYTQKTQETANLRRAAEDKIQFAEYQAQVMQHAFKEAAEVHSLQAQIQQYDSLDWNALVTSDPTRAMALNIARQQLQTQLSGAQQKLAGVGAQLQRARETHQAEQKRIGSAELERRLGKLSADDAAKLQKYGAELGFDERDFMSPAALQALHFAAKYHDLKRAQPLINKRVANAKAMSAPAARTSVQSAETAKVQGLKQRATKTGRPQDAEDYLTNLFANRAKRRG